MEGTQCPLVAWASSSTEALRASGPHSFMLNEDDPLECKYSVIAGEESQGALSILIQDHPSYRQTNF